MDKIEVQMDQSGEYDFSTADINFLNGGGWKLVRQVKAGRKWHPAKDLLAGSAKYSLDGGATFSLRFAKEKFNEFLFITGNLRKWLIASKSQVLGGWYNNELRNIQKSSKSDSPSQARWYRRKGFFQDPWISITDYSRADQFADMLYAEGSSTMHTRAVSEHGGARVYIRHIERVWEKKTPAPLNILSTKKFELIETDQRAKEAFQELLTAQKVAVDFEGACSNNNGLLHLTVFSCKPLSSDLCYVFDLEKLRTFVGLKELLESKTIEKISFDCRSDSTAVWYQYGIRMENVIDTQVMDQGYRRMNGTYQSSSFLSNMSKVTTRHFSFQEQNELRTFVPGPHRKNKNIWIKRPFSSSVLEYAINDILTIDLLYRRIFKALSLNMLFRCKMASKRYLGKFRDLPTKPKWPDDKLLFIKEEPI